MRPALVAVSRDTDDPAETDVVEAVLDTVRRRLSDVEVIRAWGDPVSPALDQVMSQPGRPAVVVPLLLSTGHHLMPDLPGEVARSAGPVHIAAPLGPDRHLARAMTARLREAGARWGDAVVLAAEGSSDPAGLPDVERAAVLLRSEWGPWVGHACFSEDGSGVCAAVEHLRQTGAARVWVAPYLLAPGRFSRKVTELAVAAGATVAEVIGGHRLLTELVLRRYRQGVWALADPPESAA